MPRPVPSYESLMAPIQAFLTASPPNTYSASQKALTTTVRLARAGHGSVAVEVLSTTARELLKLGEAGSGCELAVRMVEVMGDTKVKVDDGSRAKITQLLALTPAHGPWRKKLADAAIKWSAQECPTGDPQLHQYIGELDYKDRLFLPAEAHLLAAGKRDAANTLADLMFEWSDKGKNDPGAYAARGVLPYLAQNPPNIQCAVSFLTRFLGHLESSASACSGLVQCPAPPSTPADIQVQITTSPTINFLQLAVATVQRAPAVGTSAVQARGTDGGIARDWQQLVARYRRLAGSSGVLADKDVNEALEHISTNVFLIPPPRGGNDMLQNLMGSLFGGGMGGMGGMGGGRGIGAR